MNGSSPLRLVQVSDTHVSRERGYFNDNWRVFVAAMRAETPDLIVHTGDVSLNGPDSEDDLAFARLELDRLPVRWRAIAGNHDVGEAPRYSRLAQPLDGTRLARWARHIGPTFWAEPFGAYTLIGLDSALFASDLPEEAAQFSFLEEALAASGPKMVFLHMPPFADRPDDAAFTTSAIPYEARARLLDACVAGGVTTLACGHCHVYHRTEYRGIDIVWAPGTAFVNMAREHARRGNFPRPGYLRWTLDGNGLQHDLVEPALMFACDVGRWNDDVGSTTKLPPRPWVEPAA